MCMDWDSNKQQTPQEDTFVILKDGCCFKLESFWRPIMACKDIFTLELHFIETNQISLIVKRKI